MSAPGTWPQLELISHKLCPYVQRARIVLAEKNIPHDIHFIDLADKPAWFHEISPLGKVPVLLVDGSPLFESAVIAEYLDEISREAMQQGGMLPSDPLRRARSRAWIAFASSTLDAVASLYRAPEVTSFERAASTLRDRFTRLERELAEGPYFNGLYFSLADAAFAPIFRYFDVIDSFADLGLFAGKPRLVAWRQALQRRMSVQKAVVPEYQELLVRFLAEQNSVLGRLVRSSVLRRTA